MERLQSRAEIDQKMFRGLVARKLHKRVLSPADLTFFQKRFASGEGLVSIHSLAVYIHEQINGTFEDIFHQLSKRVDLLEYPNNGSSTQVTLEDARVIVEDIGAHADYLPKFLEDDKHRDKSVGFRTEPEAFESSIDGLDCLPQSACVPTAELLENSRRQAVGIWYKRHADGGYLVYSQTNMTDVYRLTAKYLRRHPVDKQFNRWYQKTRAKVGWRALGHAQVNPQQSGTMSRMKTQLSSRNTCPSITALGIVTLPASSKLKDNVANA